MDQITDEERLRIAELVAEGAPPWKLHQEINRSRHAIRRAVVALHRPARRVPQRSPLRLSLEEREEISRGLAAGESVRAMARRLGRAPSTVCREVAANWAAPRFPDSGIGAISCCPLPVQVLVVDFLRSPVAECRMETSPIIPELDVPGNVLSRFPDRRVHGTVNPLDFNSGIEGLGQRAMPFN